MRILTSISCLALSAALSSACSSKDDTTNPTPTPDAGAPKTDAGGGGSDAGGGADAGGGGGTCTLAYAGCTPQTMTDVGDTDTTVKFGMGGNRYEPRCLRIKAGRTVTFDGQFAAHPLDPAACNPPGTAFQDSIPTVKSGATATAKLTKPGIYAYYCDVHGTPTGSATDMVGLVEVVP